MGFINRGVIVVEVKRFVGRGQDGNFVRLRFDAQVIVTRVVPSTYVKPGDGFTRLELRERVWTLQIAIEMVVVHRRHAGVVEMAGAVPDAILLLHSHVAHLYGKEILDHRLPDAALIAVS